MGMLYSLLFPQLIQFHISKVRITFFKIVDTNSCWDCSLSGSFYMLQVGAIIVYTYVFKMLAPPPGRTFDGSEDDELPVKESEENVVPRLAKYPIPTSTHTSAVPEDEPLLSAGGDKKECATSVGSKVRKCSYGFNF